MGGDGTDSDTPWAIFEQTKSFRSAKNRELLAYWTETAGERAFPDWRDIDLMALHRVATGLIVKDIEDGGQIFRNRYWGRRLTEVMGIEATGRLHDEIYAPNMVHWATDFYRQVMQGVYPARLVSRVLSNPERSHFKYEAIMLPLGGKGNGVRHIIAHFDFDNVPTALEKKALK